MWPSASMILEYDDSEVAFIVKTHPSVTGFFLTG
jgi:hypothetical protein